jgi:hypothetical protein
LSLLNDILTWATSDLTAWQRDALRRLFQQQELSQQDFDDLYAMLKSAHGLSDPQNRQPIPLAQEHLPSPQASTSPVILRSLRDLKHVNRIAAGQKLDFSPNGITITYGGNASGKSGYSRVLKRACRARDLAETVHPDAFDPKAATSIPEAAFEVEVGGQLLALVWKRDASPPEALSTVAVFDSRCARAYLDAEQDVAFLPYGLDIVENLGQRVLPTLSEKLNAETQSISTDTTPFADLLGDSAVGKAIASLSAETDTVKLTALATIAQEESVRLAELENALAESDPKAKAKALRLSAQRMEGLSARIDAALLWVNDAALDKLRTYDNEAEAASKTEAIAAVSLRAADALLPGTGEQVWKNLFDAARRFSTEVAYPEASFPYVAADAKCLLCQQPLDQDTGKRMQRFEAYLMQDTAKLAAEKRQQRATAERKITDASLSFGFDAATTGELEQLEATVLNAIQDWEKAIEARRGWMLTALKTHAWSDPVALEADPRPSLKTLSAKLVVQATDLERAANEAQRKALELERVELRTRTALGQRLKSVLDLVIRMGRKACLTKCKNDLKTRAISDKSKEFASKAVTGALRNALNSEFQVLGVGHIKTKLNERVEQGKMKHKLVLDLPVTRKLDEILSEGEQRMIAVGSFLAELHLAGHQGAIVFDDPVSSLDHHWRRNVAQRLVQEAKNRQVIVLTHDTVFLGELRDAIEQQSVEHLINHLDWASGRPGHVSPGLPWEHQSYKDRLDRHEKAQRELDKRWPAYPNEQDRAEMRQEYDRLRATIERVVQDVVFNGVVQRYRDWIRLDKLDEVVGVTQVECSEMRRLHHSCDSIVDAHDPSSAKDAPVPTPAQLNKDITDLKTVIASILARRKTTAVSKP